MAIHVLIHHFTENLSVIMGIVYLLKPFFIIYPAGSSCQQKETRRQKTVSIEYRRAFWLLVYSTLAMVIFKLEPDDDFITV